MARATAAGPTPLMKAQSLRLIDAWPCPVRIARDLTCPDCGFPELVAQTVITAKLNARFVEACANEGPIGSKRRATELLKSIAKTTQEN